MKTKMIACIPIFVFTILMSFGMILADDHQTVEKNVETLPDSLPITTAQDSLHKVIAYYFHTTHRCATCLKIENYSHEAIEKGFADELQDGRLEWRMVNTDEEENEHFVEDFELYTKSLILVEIKDGEQIRWKNCTKVWELLMNKDAFRTYVQDEVRSFLGDS